MLNFSLLILFPSFTPSLPHSFPPSLLPSLPPSFLPSFLSFSFSLFPQLKLIKLCFVYVHILMVSGFNFQH